jgi:sporulation protein YlmC with PRC-barrel domain
VNDTGRVLHAGLQLLDRQLVDREGRLCGKVDDLELSEPDESGSIHVAAVLAGPGALLARMGRTRLGDWLRAMAAHTIPGQGDDPVRIPIARVSDIGDHVTLSMDSKEVATVGAERWARDHVIGHIPGNGLDADR